MSDKPIAITCDMGDPKQIEKMFNQIESELGPVSKLVNNAGIAMPQDFLETSLEDFQEVININLTGSFLALQRAAKTMVDKKLRVPLSTCHRSMQLLPFRLLCPTALPKAV